MNPKHHFVDCLLAADKQMPSISGVNASTMYSPNVSASRAHEHAPDITVFTQTNANANGCQPA